MGEREYAELRLYLKQLLSLGKLTTLNFHYKCDGNCHIDLSIDNQPFKLIYNNNDPEAVSKLNKLKQIVDERIAADETDNVKTESSDAKQKQDKNPKPVRSKANRVKATG